VAVANHESPLERIRMSADQGAGRILTAGLDEVLRFAGDLGAEPRADAAPQGGGEEGTPRLVGVEIGRKHVRTLMERIGIAAPYRKRGRGAPHSAHPICPYLLKRLISDRPNQARADVITYTPTKRGFVCLAAIKGSQFESAGAQRRSP
jgi:hypothetical protein